MLLVDQPLLYTHQYTYFTNALRIAQHPDPPRYVWTSDAWRTWDGHWTIAPLYHLFLALLVKLFGPGLGAIRFVQSLMDAAAAVGVALLAREAGARRFWLAGVGYALWFSAIEMPSWTMTENLHTVLFVYGVLFMARAASLRPRDGVRAGVTVAVAAFARSVSTGFLGLGALWLSWRAWRESRSWRAALPGAIVLASGFAVILPWTARNAFVIGDAVLIESAAFENIWFANHFTDPVRYKRQEEYIHSLPTGAEKRKAALWFAVRGWTREPGKVLEKTRSMFWHFLRPEGLQGVLVLERTGPPWYHTLTILLDDLPLLIVIPLFAAFWVGGRPSPARAAILIWAGYYLLMVTVVFHNEVRYRSALMPFAFAGALAGWDALRSGERRRRVLAGLAVGLLIVAGELKPFVRPAVQWARSAGARHEAQAALDRGDVPAAFAATTRAAGIAWRSARVWQDLGQELVRRGRYPEALQAYALGVGRATPVNVRSDIAAAWLLRATGVPGAEHQAVTTLHRESYATDPWVMLESAWREVPAPTTDLVQLGDDDYGAVRGFQHPRGIDPAISRPYQEWNRYEAAGSPKPPPGPHRWSRARAWIRLVPATRAAAYDLTIEMGVPFPAPNDSQLVSVRVGDVHQDIAVGGQVAPYRLRVPAPPAGQPLVVELRTTPWTIQGEPAGQGVRVDRVSVSPSTP